MILGVCSVLDVVKGIMVKNPLISPACAGCCVTYTYLYGVAASVGRGHRKRRNYSLYDSYVQWFYQGVFAYRTNLADERNCVCSRGSVNFVRVSCGGVTAVTKIPQACLYKIRGVTECNYFTGTGLHFVSLKVSD